MRTSSAIIMAIMLSAFGVILFAADMAVGPLARDAAVGKELTSLFHLRQQLVKDTEVQIHHLPASEKRLADEGAGLVVRATPAPAIAGRPDRLLNFARRLAMEGLEHYRGRNVDWIELDLELDGRRRRSLLRFGPEGDLGRPQPPLASPRAPRSAPTARAKRPS